MIASIEDRAYPEMDRCCIVKRHPGAVFGRITFERQVEMGKMLRLACRAATSPKSPASAR